MKASGLTLKFDFQYTLYYLLSFLIVVRLDSVTHADIAAIAENLSHLTPDKRLELARHLNFTDSEVKAKAVYCPPDELLLILLLEWRRRYPIANKRLLAKTLAKCGQYAEATKLDAACKFQLGEFSILTHTQTHL